MRIPDGDLVPRRRHTYGGGYGRRRRFRARVVAAVVAGALVAAAGVWFLQRDPAPARQALKPCPTPTVSAAPTLPAPSQVRFTLLNGTSRNGLAKQVGDALRKRGFVVLKEDNAPAALPGASVISYGAAAREAAVVLSRHVLGSRLATAPSAGAAGAVQLVLGGDFARLATPAEVGAVSVPSLTPVPTPAATRGDCDA